MSQTRSGEPFDLTTLLAGRTTAWGIFQDRFGKVRRRFRVDIDGQWAGAEFVLNESFAYDDGASETRVWRIRPGADGRFTAVTEDCIGEARGRADGGTITMAYVFRLRLATRTLIVRFDDDIHRVDERVAVNRAMVNKWGIRLGEVTLVFQRETAHAGQQERAVERAA